MSHQTSGEAERAAGGPGRSPTAAGSVVTSAANPVAKRVRALRERRARLRERAFVVEGIAPVWQAVEAGAEIQVLLVSDDLLGDSPATRLVAEQSAAGVRVVRTSRELFVRLSDREGPSGLMAVVGMPPADPAGIATGPADVVVAAYQLASPGNLGTVIRSAEAFGARALLLVGEGTDPYAPQAVKASMGSLFHLPVAHLPDLDALLAWATEHDATLVTTSAHASLEVTAAALTGPVVLLLGAERTGLPASVRQQAGADVRIAMHGHATSLNVAVAAGILLHEVTRQVREAAGS